MSEKPVTNSTPPIRYIDRLDGESNGKSNEGVPGNDTGTMHQTEVEEGTEREVVFIEPLTATERAAASQPEASAPKPPALESLVAPASEQPSSARLAKPPMVRTRSDERGLRRLWRGVKSVSEWIVGYVCIIVGLAVLAAIPVLQILSFGYLLEVSGRIVRERRLRSGFIGVRKAARVGFLLLHSWLMFLPLRLLSDVWHDAQLIDPMGGAARGLRIAQLVLTLATLGHVLSAWYSGGRARHFYWPLLSPYYAYRSLRGQLEWRQWFPPARMLSDVKQGGVYQRARDGVWDFFVSLNFPYYFRLGALGLAGAAIWLAIPVLLLAGAAALPRTAATLSGLVGGVLLAAVAVRLPFMEANFAATGKWSRLMDRKLAGQQCSRAPLAFWLALLLCLALAIPLHLIQAAPPILPELSWLLNLLFVVLLLPARFVAGWAVSRAEKREQPRIAVSRYASRFGAIPIALFYALVVYFAQFINYYGSWRLLEQPAFMLPAPFWLIG